MNETEFEKRFPLYYSLLEDPVLGLTEGNQSPPSRTCKYVSTLQKKRKKRICEYPHVSGLCVVSFFEQLIWIAFVNLRFLFITMFFQDSCGRRCISGDAKTLERLKKAPEVCSRRNECRSNNCCLKSGETKLNDDGETVFRCVNDLSLVDTCK